MTKKAKKKKKKHYGQKGLKLMLVTNFNSFSHNVSANSEIYHYTSSCVHVF